MVDSNKHNYGTVIKRISENYKVCYRQEDNIIKELVLDAKTVVFCGTLGYVKQFVENLTGGVNPVIL